MNRCFYLLAIVLLFGCSNGQQPNNQAPAPEAEQPATTAPKAATYSLPGIPLDIVQKIYNEGTSVDYLFYELPISMSLTEQKSIQFAIRHISDSPAPDRPDCKPTGRVTYQIKGEIALEADFYFTKSCTFFIFYKDKQKAYANLMTEEGVKYFGSQIQQGLQLRNPSAKGEPGN